MTYTTTKPQPIREDEPVTWRLADEYVPTHNRGMWSRTVITISNYGTVLPLMYSNVWQRPAVYASTEFVQFWIDSPFDAESL